MPGHAGTPQPGEDGEGDGDGRSVHPLGGREPALTHDHCSHSHTRKRPRNALCPPQPLPPPPPPARPSPAPVPPRSAPPDQISPMGLSRSSRATTAAPGAGDREIPSHPHVPSTAPQHPPTTHLHGSHHPVPLSRPPRVTVPTGRSQHPGVAAAGRVPVLEPPEKGRQGVPPRPGSPSSAPRAGQAGAPPPVPVPSSGPSPPSLAPTRPAEPPRFARLKNWETGSIGYDTLCAQALQVGVCRAGGCRVGGHRNRGCRAGGHGDGGAGLGDAGWGVQGWGHRAGDMGWGMCGWGCRDGGGSGTGGVGQGPPGDPPCRRSCPAQGSAAWARWCCHGRCRPRSPRVPVPPRSCWAWPGTSSPSTTCPCGGERGWRGPPHIPILAQSSPLPAPALLRGAPQPHTRPRASLSPISVLGHPTTQACPKAPHSPFPTPEHPTAQPHPCPGAPHSPIPAQDTP